MNFKIGQIILHCLRRLKKKIQKKSMFETQKLKVFIKIEAHWILDRTIGYPESDNFHIYFLR